jgi:hypothetical protein
MTVSTGCSVASGCSVSAGAGSVGAGAGSVASATDVGVSAGPQAATIKLNTISNQKTEISFLDMLLSSIKVY